MANRKQCAALIDKIETHSWKQYRFCAFDQEEADVLLQLLQKWMSESNRHQKEYAENSDYYKKVNSDRYYAKKDKESQRRKKKYNASKLEVFKK